MAQNAEAIAATAFRGTTYLTLYGVLLARLSFAEQALQLNYSHLNRKDMCTASIAPLACVSLAYLYKVVWCGDANWDRGFAKWAS
jgi:hypothetical protein